MWEWRFGWKNSSEQWNDDAVWTVGELPDNLGGWNELRHPMTGDSVDLAFQITTEPEEPPLVNVITVDITPFASPGISSIGTSFNTMGMALQAVDQGGDFNVTEVTPAAFRALNAAQLSQYDLIAINNDPCRIDDATNLGIGTTWQSVVGVNQGGRVLLTSHDAPRFKMTFVNPPNAAFGGSTAGSNPGPGVEPFGAPDLVRQAALWTGGFAGQTGLLVFNDAARFAGVGGVGWDNPELNLPAAWSISDLDQSGGGFAPGGGYTDILAAYAGHPVYAGLSDARFGVNSISSFAANIVDTSFHSIFGSYEPSIFIPTEVITNSGVLDPGNFLIAETTTVSAPDGTAITLLRNAGEEPPKEPVPNLKWSQPPIEMDPTADTPTFWGWDELSYTNDPCCEHGIGWQVVADDFRCLGSMPITSIHWWGSHFDWEDPCEMLPAFELPVAWRIGFWSNVPADPCIPYSRPEVLLWQIEVPADRVDVDQVGTDYFCTVYPNDVAYQYYLDLEPEEVFWQEKFEPNTVDNIFWLSIAAVYPVLYEPLYPWGWKTRPWSWMDDAVTFSCAVLQQGMVLDPYFFTPIEDPVYYESYDVAFELDTDPNYIKWEQPFTGIRDWPHYEDELSMAEGFEPFILRLVADDWLCDGNTPVNAIVWWGSYIGYAYNVGHIEEIPPPMPPPVKPDYFRLNIWTDVPAGADPCYPYSHPNDIIWEYDAYDYDEVLVGYDKHPLGEPNEPVFRYSVRLPEADWFLQDDVNNNVYWLSVVAVYDLGVPNYDWGWTNHKHMFNDDAVEGYFDPPTGWFWYELYDQNGETEDMSFILFTDPYCFPQWHPDFSMWLQVGSPECWCPAPIGSDYQCKGDADGVFSGFDKDGKRKYVVLADLNVLRAGWQLFDNDPNFSTFICADFDHAFTGFDKDGKRKHVTLDDLKILRVHWQLYDNDPCMTTCFP